MTATKLLRAYSHFPAHIRRSAPRQVFLLTVEVRPIPGNADVAGYDGAFVNCWVNVDDLQQAEQRVLSLLPDHGWQVQQFESWQLVTRTDYLHCGMEVGSEVDSDVDSDVDSESGKAARINYRELVDLALIDGIACLTHVWSEDPEAGDPDAEDAPGDCLGS